MFNIWSYEIFGRWNENNGKYMSDFETCKTSLMIKRKEENYKKKQKIKFTLLLRDFNPPK